MDKSLHNQGYGSTLVAHAMKVVFQASVAVGIHGLFVEALSDKAENFYLDMGLIALDGTNEHALFYPIKAIETLFVQERE
jgi:3-deoxy-D-manno-octulosonic acid (KDO) 8-phosphate synthase